MNKKLLGMTALLFMEHLPEFRRPSVSFGFPWYRLQYPVARFLFKANRVKSKIRDTQYEILYFLWNLSAAELMRKALPRFKYNIKHRVFDINSPVVLNSFQDPILLQYTTGDAETSSA